LISGKANLVLRRGDLVTLESSGGGGYGARD
jgi:N-methylhydantoinase B/oxoprolinase/acetone carboxylase alpha subunit